MLRVQQKTFRVLPTSHPSPHLPLCENLSTGTLMSVFSLSKPWGPGIQPLFDKGGLQGAISLGWWLANQRCRGYMRLAEPGTSFQS